jgi:hypothetical protein
VVRVDGTGFQLPSLPPAVGSGPVPAPAATVRAFFGGTEARRVRVASSTVLFLTTERADPNGPVSLEVRNVGPLGETIGSERVVAASAFSYVRPDFTAVGTLQLVSRALIQELKRQVFPEVVLSQSIDWSDAPGSALRKVALAKLPSVWLAGPTLRENKVYQQNEYVPTDLGGGLTLARRNGRTVDLVFGFGAVSATPMELLQMVSALEDFFQRNPWLYVPQDAGSSTTVRFDLDLEQDLQADMAPSEDNVMSASGSLAIAGVDMGEDVQVTVDPQVTEAPDWSTERVS